MKNKIIYISSIILSLFIGIAGTMVVYHFFPVKGEMIEKTVSNINIKEEGTIKSSISKVYDATFFIKSYNNNRLSSTGTGFVYKKDDKGYLITNHHVIDGASKVMVVNNNGQEVEATLLGSDEYADIAVLSIPKEAVMQVVTIGDSTKLNLGDTLFTVGSPLGEEYIGTVTKGILSGKNRTVSVTVNQGSFMMEVIQTDAAINPGNSGGPLCNINGEVIGVNSLKLVKDEVEGMGFAIPIELVMSSVDRLEKGEKIERPVIGVTMLDLSNTWELYTNKIIIDDSVKNGVVVVSVVDDTPAKEAGLKTGDVITKIEDIKIKNSAHFRYILYKYSVGDKIKVTYNRNGKEAVTTLMLSKGL